MGDALVLAVAAYGGNGVTVSSVSGGGATWQKLTNTNDSAADMDSELWLGTVTTSGNSSITVSYGGSYGADWMELDAQEYSSSAGASTNWAPDTSGVSDNNSSSTTITFPSLTPSSGAGELYVGYSPAGNAAAAGSTSGFTYVVTPNNKLFIYDPTSPER